MDSAYEVADPTDWLNTPLAAFAPLENSLHCQICKEFYDTPMITSCSHTFCSKCIRTSLSNDGKCPACRAPDQASKLRNNWAIDELVNAFKEARPAALKVAKKEQEEALRAKRPGKRKRAVLDSDNAAQAESETRTTRSKSRRTAASQASQASETIEIDDSDGDDSFEPEPEPEPEDGLVPCPMCSKRMKEEAVFPHLDRCEQEQKESRKSKSRTPVNITQTRRALSQPVKPQQRLAQLSYSMMNDTAMRKKFNELGIPSWGAKQLLVRRHTEWVNLWNANCDSNQPRSKRELLQDLDTWERTQGGRAPNVNGTANGIMRKDFDGEGWANKNKDDFSRLIADARRKKVTPSSTPAPEKEEAPQEDAKPEEDGSKPTLDGDEDSSPSFAAHPDAPPAPPDPTHRPSHPYENNPAALSSIRSKVQAANENRHSSPLLNADFEAPSSRDPANILEQPSIPDPATALYNGALLGQAHFGFAETRQHEEHDGAAHGQECELPAHLKASPSKKVPMFAVPAEPVVDVDGGDVAV